MQLTFGNRNGQYFTQWRFDLLEELLERIHLGPNPPSTEVVEIEDAEIWYDEYEDFHRLKFKARGHFVEVQFYKVFASKIDGTEHWVGCPRSNIWEYAVSIREKLGVTIKEP